MFTVDNMMLFENGDLSKEDTIAMFQDIWDKKLYLTLQGFYGRYLKKLIDAGYINIE